MNIVIVVGSLHYNFQLVVKVTDPYFKRKFMFDFSFALLGPLYSENLQCLDEALFKVFLENSPISLYTQAMHILDHGCP